jgi:hypothetical protein
LFLSDVEKSVRTPSDLGEDFLALLDKEKSVLTLGELVEDFLALPDVEKSVLTPYIPDWEGLPRPYGRGEVRPDL